MKIEQQQNFEKKKSTHTHTPKATTNIQEVFKHQTYGKKDSLEKDKICTKDTKF